MQRGREGRASEAFGLAAQPHSHRPAASMILVAFSVERSGAARSAVEDAVESEEVSYCHVKASPTRDDRSYSHHDIYYSMREK